VIDAEEVAGKKVEGRRRKLLILIDGGRWKGKRKRGRDE